MFMVLWNVLRAVAHGRNGHGRSARSWVGNDMDACADDLREPIEELDLLLVGPPCWQRHGASRVAKEERL